MKIWLERGRTEFFEATDDEELGQDMEVEVDIHPSEWAEYNKCLLDFFGWQDVLSAKYESGRSVTSSTPGK